MVCHKSTWWSSSMSKNLNKKWQKHLLYQLRRSICHTSEISYHTGPTLRHRTTSPHSFCQFFVATLFNVCIYFSILHVKDEDPSIFFSHRSYPLTIHVRSWYRSFTIIVQKGLAVLCGIYNSFFLLCENKKCWWVECQIRYKFLNKNINLIKTFIQLSCIFLW